MIRVSREGAVEFSELGFHDFGDFRDFKVIVGGGVGYISWSVKDSEKNFELEALDAFDFGWLS